MTKKQIKKRIAQLERESRILEGLPGYARELAKKQHERNKLKDLLEQS